MNLCHGRPPVRGHRRRQACAIGTRVGAGVAFARPPIVPYADAARLRLSITEPKRCDRGRARPDILYGERGQSAALAFDAVGRQAPGRGACGEQKSAAGIEAKGARHWFGRHMAGNCQ
jgi:hypothetical protein